MNNLAPGIRIRPMEHRDIQAAAEIDRISFTLPWPEGAFDYDVHQNPGSMPYVAESVGGTIVGMIVVWFIIDEAHIATIAVHPEWRRRGIATALLRVALAAAIRRGAILATLEVRQSNIPAQELYRSFGFEQVGQRRRYYKDNQEDALILTVSGLGSDYLGWLEGLDTTAYVSGNLI